MKGSGLTEQTGLSVELLSSLSLLPPHATKVMGGGAVLLAVTVKHANAADDVAPPPCPSSVSRLGPPRVEEMQHYFLPRQLLRAPHVCVYSHLSGCGLPLPTPKLLRFTFPTCAVLPCFIPWIPTAFSLRSLSPANDSPFGACAICGNR